MDSEISKIWEEALRYASPLPVPGQSSKEPIREPDKFIDGQPTRGDVNSSITLQTSATNIQPHVITNVTGNLGNIIDQPVPFSVVDRNSELSNSINEPVQIISSVKRSLGDPMNTSIPVTRMDGILGNGASLVENLFARKIEGKTTNDENQETIAIDRDLFVGNRVNDTTEIQSVSETRLPVTDQGSPLVLPFTMSGRTPPSLTEQIYQLTRQQAIALDKTDSSKDVSNALAEGLKMIQQGNELIAKALKLSNTKTNTNTHKETELFHSYASLSPDSLPSLAESGNAYIPSESTPENVEVENIGQELTEAMVALSEDNFVSSSSSYSEQLDREKGITYLNTDQVDSTLDSNTGEPKMKRKRRREKNPNPMPCVPILPPCRVCDEKSSGFHYGANTCEACKGFFRRTLKKQEVKFQCKCREEEKQAWKSGPVKNICPACRYERCLFVGMSKNAIKIGRYTLNRKTENIREVKSLEAMDNLIDKAICSSVNSETLSIVQSTSTGSVISSPENMSMSETLSNTESPYCTTTTRSVSPTLHQGSMTVSEIQTIVKDITEAHKVSQMHDPTLVNRPKEVVNQIHKKYLEAYNLKEKVFGNMKPLSKEEYKDFYNATGIDIDGRQQALEEGLQHFTKKIVQFVEYAKTIPGFSDLSTQDQASLIKYSRPEHVILAGYRNMMQNISPDLQVCTTPWGKEVHLKDIGKIMPKDMMITRFKYAKRLYNIGMTIEEEAILRAIVITFSDRCELEDPEMVQEIQYKLITCLDYLTSLRPTNGRRIFHQILDILVGFRNFSEQEYKATKEMVFDWPCMSSYTLLRELFF